MTTSPTFTAAKLARTMNINPKLARMRLRKAKGLPPCVEGPHGKNEAWTFSTKHRERIAKVIAGAAAPATPAKKATTKKAKVTPPTPAVEAAA